MGFREKTNINAASQRANPAPLKTLFPRIQGTTYFLISQSFCLFLSIKRANGGHYPLNFPITRDELCPPNPKVLLKM